MRNIAFDAFIGDTLALTRSMVIKIEEIALKDNTMLTEAGFSVSDDKTTWRYYMNMNGEYHETDTPMYINSIDTGEKILFSKENLDIHLATAREYRARTYWYKRLLELNPAQIDLIKGILSPIPYTVSLAAENYKILNYDSNYVEPNEYQLIPELQRRIHAETHKTLNNDYLITEDLMLTILLCNLTATVFKAICNIRFNAIGTRHAHSFYIWSHIDSFGNFSRYKDSLNNYQTMWLYRNIHWLINHAGQNDNFDYLLKNLLTERNVPLAKFDMVLSTEGQETTFIPKVNFRRSNLNLLEDYGVTPSFIPPKTLIAKERRMAVENEVYEDEYLAETVQLSQISLFSELPTKVLESSMMDTTNIHQDTRLTTLFNNWIYLTHKNIYRASILATNPKTGQQFRINPGDAWHLWYYLVNAAAGNPPLAIEPAYYSRCLKVNPPSIAQLQDIGGTYFIDNVLAKDIRALTYSHGIIITPEKLLSASEDVYAIMWKQRKLYSQFYDVNKRARVKNTVNSMLESGFARITSFNSYDALINNYELNFEEWTPDELLTFAYGVFQASTAWGLVKTNSLGEIQSDLISLMSDLSSYTVQIVKEIVEGGDTIEIPNENFVGRPLWTEGDFWDIGDFSGVQLDFRGYLTPWLDSKLAISITPDKPLVIKSITGDGVMDLFDGDHPIEIVEVDNQDSLVGSVRLTDNSYCYLLAAPEPDPIPDAYVIDNAWVESTLTQGWAVNEDYLFVSRITDPNTSITAPELDKRAPDGVLGITVTSITGPNTLINGPRIDGILVDEPTTFEYGVVTSLPYPETGVVTSWSYPDIKYGVVTSLPYPEIEYGAVTSWPYPEVGIDINSTHLPTVSDLEVTVYKVVLPSKYISMIESEEIVAYSGVTEEPFTVTKSISMIESRDILVTQGVTEEPFTVTKSIGMIESRDIVVTQGITEEPFTVTKSIGMIESEEIVVYSGVTEEPFTVTKSIGMIETEEV